MSLMNSAKYTPTSLFISPTLIIGLGGSGTEVVRLVKARIRRAMGKLPEIVEFLALDTEPCNNPPGMERIFAREFGYLGDYNASDVLNHLDRYPHIKDWWPAQGASVTGTIHKGARQRRIVGRLSLYVRWNEFVIPLQRKIDRIRDIAAKEAVEKRDVEVDRASGQVQVYIVSSLCGGTGAGIFLDVAFRVRKALGDDADILGVFMLPSCFLDMVQSRIQRQRIQANTAASLLELNYFMQGNPFEACFPDQPYLDRNGNKNVTTLFRPFDSTYMVDRSNGKELLDGLSEVQKMIAQQIFLDMVTPIGKRWQARRANLRDLAGEQGSRADGAFSDGNGVDIPPLPDSEDNDSPPISVPVQARSEPLFVAGFCTASLILPLAETVQSARDLAATRFIETNLLGHEPTGEARRDLERAVETEFDQFRNRLRFERVQPSAGPVQPEGNDDDPYAGASAAEAGATATIDLTRAEAEIHTAFEALRAFLQDAYETRPGLGLRGVRFLIDDLLIRARGHRNYLSGEDNRLSNELNNLQTAESTAIDEPPKSGCIGLVVGPVYKLFGSQTPHQTEVSTWEASRAARRDAIAEIQVLQSRNRVAIEATDRLTTALQSISANLHARVVRFEELCQRMSRTPEVRPDSDGVPDDQRIELFELATPVGWETHQIDGRGDVSFLGSQREQLANKIAGLDPSQRAELIRHIDAAGLSLQFALDPNGRGGHDLGIRDLTPGAEDRLREITTGYFLEQATIRGPERLGVRIADYLQWLYDTVPYGVGTQRATMSSRYTPKDPMNRLNNRVRRIFLDADETTLGSEASANTEPVRIIGSDRDRSQDELIDDLLEDFDRWENVATATPDRIDASFSRHGFPVRALRQRNDFRESYQFFTSTLGEKIHLHDDWHQDTFDIEILT